MKFASSFLLAVLLAVCSEVLANSEVSNSREQRHSDCRCLRDWVYYDGSCYAFLDDFVPWTSAQVFCRLLNPAAALVEINNMAENNFVKTQLTTRFGTSFHAWMGMNDLLKEGQYVYNSNGLPLTYTNWASGQPDDSKTYENGEDCIMMFTDGTWNDLPCETYLTGWKPLPVCEMRALQM